MKDCGLLFISGMFVLKMCSFCILCNKKDHTELYDLPLCVEAGTNCGLLFISVNQYSAPPNLSRELHWNRSAVYPRSHCIYRPTLWHSTNHCYMSYGCYSDIEANHDHCPIGLLLTTKPNGERNPVLYKSCFW